MLIYLMNHYIFQLIEDGFVKRPPLNPDRTGHSMVHLMFLLAIILFKILSSEANVKTSKYVL
jgi:hypothetical protein